ncbi:hypothetical protein BC826DRAFT_146946 [Russula brevipes]|nr:hypothetical protein BC826DRAFT_146946 [Russula brevipes]
MFSLGFQSAFQRGFEADDEVFFAKALLKSLESAKTVVTALVDSLVPTGYIRFAPDGYFVFATFASAFMLKLLRPEYSRFITPGLETDVYQTIERLINTIGSPQIAIDERRTPKLYSRFLASLLAKHRRDGTAHGRMHQQGPPAQQSQTGSAPQYISSHHSSHHRNSHQRRMARAQPTQQVSTARVGMIYLHPYRLTGDGPGGISRCVTGEWVRAQLHGRYTAGFRIW